jgi:hypothetical protein
MKLVKLYLWVAAAILFWAALQGLPGGPLEWTVR